MNNETRARMAGDAVAHMAYRSGKSDTPLQEQVVLALANIRHLCGAQGLNFRELLAESFDEFDAVRAIPGEPEEVDADT